MHIKIAPFVIATSKLLIRPHKSGDEVLLNRAVLDSFDPLHRWMHWAKIRPSLEDTKNFIEHSQKCWASQDPKELPLLIFDAEEKNIIGATGFHDINWKIPSFSMGYWANIHYTGQGLITEATAVLIDYVFSEWRAKRIEIVCDSQNLKSASIPKRLEFILEGHLKNNRIQCDSNKVSGTFIFAKYDSIGLPDIPYQTRPLQ